MHVKVFNDNIEVEVSKEGMFFDVATRKFSSRTLTGLQKKIREAYTPKGNVTVERKDNHKIGTAISRTGTRWSSQYVVNWSDGSRTTEKDWELRKPTTEEDRKKIAAAKEAIDVAEAALQTAQNVLEELEDKFDVEDDLDKHFPAKK